MQQASSQLPISVSEICQKTLGMVNADNLALAKSIVEQVKDELVKTGCVVGTRVVQVGTDVKETYLYVQSRPASSLLVQLMRDEFSKRSWKFGGRQSITNSSELQALNQQKLIKEDVADDSRQTKTEEDNKD
ncbi:MAG: hypothetical protein M1607_01170 [Patescibacteria group bacterium]|nr:hypothetical protein [Patescibacteria group bacterium]